MLLPTIKIDSQEELGKAVDLLMGYLKFERISPRRYRDLVFTMATLTRLANIGLQVAAHGAGSEAAQAAVTDAFIKKTAKDAAKALGYEMKDKVRAN